MAVKEEFVCVPHLCASNIILWQEISFLRPLGFCIEVFHPTVGQWQWSRTSQTNKDVRCWNAALRWRSWTFLSCDNEMLFIKKWRVISYKNTRFYSNLRAIHKPDASSHPHINHWLGLIAISLAIVPGVQVHIDECCRALPVFPHLFK